MRITLTTRETVQVSIEDGRRGGKVIAGRALTVRGGCAAPAAVVFAVPVEHAYAEMLVAAGVREDDVDDVLAMLA